MSGRSAGVFHITRPKIVNRAGAKKNTVQKPVPVASSTVGIPKTKNITVEIVNTESAAPDYSNESDNDEQTEFQSEGPAQKRQKVVTDTVDQENPILINRKHPNHNLKLSKKEKRALRKQTMAPLSNYQQQNTSTQTVDDDIFQALKASGLDQKFSIDNLKIDESVRKLLEDNDGNDDHENFSMSKKASKRAKRANQNLMKNNSRESQTVEASHSISALDSHLLELRKLLPLWATGKKKFVSQSEPFDKINQLINTVESFMKNQIQAGNNSTSYDIKSYCNYLIRILRSNFLKKKSFRPESSSTNSNTNSNGFKLFLSHLKEFDDCIMERLGLVNDMSDCLTNDQIKQVPVPHEFYLEVVKEQFKFIKSNLDIDSIVDKLFLDREVVEYVWQKLDENEGSKSTNGNKESNLSDSKTVRNPLQIFYLARYIEEQFFQTKTLTQNLNHNDNITTLYSHTTRDWAARLYSFAIPTMNMVREIKKSILVDQDQDTNSTIEIIEIGAGLGYWANYLKQSLEETRGPDAKVTITVHAYDVMPPKNEGQQVFYRGNLELNHSVNIESCDPTLEKSQKSVILNDGRVTNANNSTKGKKATTDNFKKLKSNSSHDSNTNSYIGINDILLSNHNDNPGPIRILLLSFPPPSDRMALSALKKFTRGNYLFYCGEWSTGLTADKDFHVEICRRMTLVKLIDLPQWATTCHIGMLFRFGSESDSVTRASDSLDNQCHGTSASSSTMIKSLQKGFGILKDLIKSKVLESSDSDDDTATQKLQLIVQHPEYLWCCSESGASKLISDSEVTLYRGKSSYYRSIVISEECLHKKSEAEQKKFTKLSYAHQGDEYQWKSVAAATPKA